jgi:hypothetical protein
VRLLRLWLGATAIVLAGMAVCALAPLLAFMALLTLALGVLAAGVVLLAHRLRAWRERQ